MSFQTDGNTFKALRGVIITRRTCAVNYDESIISNITSVVRYVLNVNGLYFYDKDNKLVAEFELLSNTDVNNILVNGNNVDNIYIPIPSVLPNNSPNIIDVVANITGTKPTTTTTTGSTTIITIPQV